MGTMRLPEDHDEAVALLRHAIDSGMKYIDTSRGYGESEIKIGKALKDGYREKVILSTKWCPWVMKVEESDDTSSDCMRKRIEESMSRLDVDYLDYYQIWNIDSREHYDQAIAKGGMLEGVQKAMSDGLVGHTGFTTHDNVENLLTYIEEADWCEIILFTYNLLNQSYGPAIEAAHKKGIGTVIMNPVGGGILNNPSVFLNELVNKSGSISAADLGIRYLMSNPSVTTIIAGINKTSDVDNTINSVIAGSFTAPTMESIQTALTNVAMDKEQFCTGCRYCMPCPQDIDIPAVMSAISDFRLWGFQQSAKDAYHSMKTPGAEACVKCGACEAKCTQHLGIMEEMGYALNTFGPKT
jgi:predicted aldo/keto reductase-like oxidoreductase